MEPSYQSTSYWVMCAIKSLRSGIGRFNAEIAVALGILRRHVDVQPPAATAPKSIASLLMVLALPQKSVLTVAALILLLLLPALSG